MCIGFFNINSQAPMKHYRLIIAFNRDEFFHRKTEKADYWTEDNTIIGGRDMESDSHGSWLAVSSKGKIGVLLNINKQPLIKNAESRGVLVANFLKENLSLLEYNQKLQQSQEIYNGYHLLLFDIMSDKIDVILQTNAEYNKPLETIILSDGTYGLSNSPMNLPYDKVRFGKQKFEDILKRYNSCDDKDFLVNEILNLLKSEERYYPDRILYESKQGEMPEEYIEKLGTIFVKIPEKYYGTRTHTIILLRSDNYLEFNEFTMKEPINIETIEWTHQHFLIKIQKSG